MHAVLLELHFRFLAASNLIRALHLGYDYRANLLGGDLVGASLVGCTPLSEQESSWLLVAHLSAKL